MGLEGLSSEAPIVPQPESNELSMVAHRALATASSIYSALLLSSTASLEQGSRVLYPARSLTLQEPDGPHDCIRIDR